MYFIVDNLKYAQYLANSNNMHILKAKLNPGKCVDTLNGSSQLIIANEYKKLSESNSPITATILYKKVVAQYREKVQSIRGFSLHGGEIIDHSGKTILHKYQSILLCVLDRKCITELEIQRSCGRD